MTVLDVGHGNTAVAQGPGGVVVVDAGPGGGTLLQYLDDEGIGVIDCVVISHADEDHLRGLIGVLESDSVAIREVRMNANAIKATDLYDDVVYSLDHQDQQGALVYFPSCVDGDGLPAVADDLAIDVIGPTKGLAGHGPGWTDPQNRRATTNSCSVVVRIMSGSTPVILLPGDIDEMGFAYLTERHSDISAPVLVFPHHGGKVRDNSSDAQNAAFATDFAQRVHPNTVIFSIGRNRFYNPRPEIVDALRAIVPDVRIACTQCSRRCRDAAHATPPADAFGHLLDLHARGKATNACCAGSLRIEPSGVVAPEAAAHAAFELAHAPTTQCL